MTMVMRNENDTRHGNFGRSNGTFTKRGVKCDTFFPQITIFSLTFRSKVILTHVAHLVDARRMN